MARARRSSPPSVRQSTRVDWRTVGGLDLRARAIRQAFVDRFEYLGDPVMMKAPWDQLVSKDYAREVAANIRRRASAERRRGAHSPTGPAGSGALRRSSTDCTTQVCAIDCDRNMVSLTHTAVSLWGSRMVVPDTGILLNNAMIWFDPEPGKANSVAPGKRVLVNMVPALAFKKGRPYLAVGAPGGRKIVSAIPQVIANLVDVGGSVQAAVEAPRVHTEGGDLLVDDRVGDKALEGLRQRGWDVVPKTETYSTFNFARPIGIRVTPKGLEAGLDPLGAAGAAGI